MDPKSHRVDLVAPAKQAIQTTQLLGNPFLLHDIFLWLPALHPIMALYIVGSIGLHWSHTTRLSSSRCMPVRTVVLSQGHLPQRIIGRRTLDNWESTMMLPRGLYPYLPNELWGRNNLELYRRK